MAYKDVLAAYLREDRRVDLEPIFKKKVYEEEGYELHILVYPPHPDKGDEHLVTFIAVYRNEALRIQARLISARITGDIASFVSQHLSGLERQGKTPLTFIRDAKNWCNIPMTEADRITFAQAGLPER